MKKVSEPVIRPNVCSVIPGRGRDAEGFVDTDVDMAVQAAHIYVSAKGLKECLKTMKWPLPDEAYGWQEDLVAANEELALRQAEMDQLQEELTEANELLDAMSVVAARKKTPPKVKENVNG